MTSATSGGTIVSHEVSPVRILWRASLERVLAVEHADVQDDLAVLIARPRLEADAHPAVAVARAFVAARGDGVGEGEEAGRGAAALLEAAEVQGVLVLQHRLEARAAHVALRLAVDRVADRHVIRRHALGDRPAAPPTLKNHRTTSCPAPISAKVP
jgi:hypothetical protein